MKTRLLVLGLIGALSSPGTAQHVEDGRLGEAGLRVGSGGYNIPRRSRVRTYANEMVTGNVRGGRSFQGSSTINSTTDFGSSLGTSTLDNFRRDSVSVGDVRSGYRSYRPNLYYSQTRTVPNTGSLSIGFQPTDGPQSSRRYINLPDDLRYRRPAQLGSRSRRIIAFPQSNRPDSLTASDPTGRYLVDRDLAVRSKLFGVAPRPTDIHRELLLAPGSKQDDYRAGMTTSGEPSSNLRHPTAGPADGQTRRRTLTGLAAPSGSAMDRLLGNRSDGPTAFGETDVSRKPDKPAEETGSGGPSVGTRHRKYGERTGEQQDRSAVGSRTRRFDEVPDVYRAMLGVASVASRLGEWPTPPEDRAKEIPTPGSKLKIEPKPDADKPDADKPATPEETEETPTSPEPGPGIVKQHQDDIQEYLDRPVITFVGADKTIANDAFSRAETRLKQGKYFDAVDAYDIARAADPANPLVWIGRGHALIGAGDYLSATRSLQEGLTRFPQLGKFKIDLKTFLSHDDILDVRRADLENRLEKGENYRLRFLLGYIEYFSGLEKFGLPNLRRAAELAPTTSVISRFPDSLRK